MTDVRSSSAHTGAHVDHVWAVVCLLGVLLPVAGVVGAALTGVVLLLVPALVVGAAVALALTVWT